MVLLYGFFPETGPNTSLLSHRSFRLIGTSNLFATTCHLQANGQVLQYNRTLLVSLRSYVADYPKYGDLYTDVFTYSYNTQVYTSPGTTPF